MSHNARLKKYLRKKKKNLVTLSASKVLHLCFTEEHQAWKYVKNSIWQMKLDQYHGNQLAEQEKNTATL